VLVYPHKKGETTVSPFLWVGVLKELILKRNKLGEQFLAEFYDITVSIFNTKCKYVLGQRFNE
jgi:hypothetical protein